MRGQWHAAPIRPTVAYVEATGDVLAAYEAMVAIRGDYRAYLRAYVALAAIMKDEPRAWHLFPGHLIRYVRQAGLDLLDIEPRSESVDFWQAHRDRTGTGTGVRA